MARTDQAKHLQRQESQRMWEAELAAELEFQRGQGLGWGVGGSVDGAGGS